MSVRRRTGGGPRFVVELPAFDRTRREPPPACRARMPCRGSDRRHRLGLPLDTSHRRSRPIDAAGPEQVELDDPRLYEHARFDTVEVYFLGPDAQLVGETRYVRTPPTPQEYSMLSFAGPSPRDYVDGVRNARSRPRPTWSPVTWPGGCSTCNSTPASDRSVRVRNPTSSRRSSTRSRPCRRFAASCSRTKGPSSSP